MFRYTLILLATASCLGCGPKKDENPLLGTYVKWITVERKPRAMDGRHGTSRLVLKSDGTYEYETGTTMMVLILRKAKGEFKLDKNEVVLTGKAETISDNGQRKRIQHGPHTASLKIVDGMLEEAGPPGSLSVWCKAGITPKPTKP